MWTHAIDKMNIGLQSIVLLKTIQARNGMKRCRYNKPQWLYGPWHFLSPNYKLLHDGGAVLNLDFIPGSDWSLNSITRILLLSVE